jgi:Putative prokaryotic signal transducing protein
MTRVYSAQNTLMVDHLRHVLDAEGIGCVVRNRFLSSALGRLPAAECWTELWILDEAQLARAQRIVERALEQNETASSSTWECPQCGERLEPQFEACWKCSTRRGAAVVEATYGEAPPPKSRPELSPSAQLWTVVGIMALVAWYLFRSYSYW